MGEGGVNFGGANVCYVFLVELGDEVEHLVA